jgi:RND family efflux transporter MFP subunit
MTLPSLLSLRPSQRPSQSLSARQRPAASVWALALLGTALLAACSKPAPAPEPVRAVRTVKVGAEAAGSATDFAAEVKARVESRLAFRVPGKLVRRTVDLGDAVRAGQLLAQIDPQDLKLAQEAAQAGVQAAHTQHEQTLADQKRTKDLFDQGFVSAAELERRDNAVKAAAASLAQARAQLNVQGNQAGYSQLLADVSGVVTAIEAEPGAVLGAGTPVLRIAQDGPRDVVFQVPEDQVGRVRALLNQRGALGVTLWGSEASLPATLRELSAAADPATRTFLAKADLGGKAEVRLGQTATVRLALGSASPAMAAKAAKASTAAVGTQAIKLPLEAIGEQKGQAVVWLLDAAQMTVTPHPVSLAAHEGRQAVIAGGLAPGQEVVVAGVHALTAGLKVKRYVEPGQAALGSVATPVALGGSAAAANAATAPASAASR